MGFIVRRFEAVLYVAGLMWAPRVVACRLVQVMQFLHMCYFAELQKSLLGWLFKQDNGNQMKIIDDVGKAHLHSGRCSSVG